MIRRLSIGAFVTIVWAATASATNLYVSPGGSGTACTPGSPCALSQANSVAQPGDVVQMADGTYSTAPLPVRSGTAALRIEYRGNPGNKRAVVVPGFVNTSFEYITWRYFKTQGVIRITPNCQATTGCQGSALPFRNIKLIGLSIGTGMYFAGTSDSKMDSCEIVPNWVDQGYFWISPMDANIGGSPEPTQRDTFSNNNITLNTGTREDSYQNGTGVLFAINDANPRLVDHCLFERNVINVSFRRDAIADPADPSRGARGAYFYGAFVDTFRYNRWTIMDSTLAGFPVDCGQRVSFRFRTQTAQNYFYRDSLIVGGRCGWVMFSSQSETNPACVVGDNRWDECYFQNTANGGGFAPFEFQYGMCRDTIQRSVFVTNFSGGGASGLSSFQVQTGPILIDHNTFFTTATTGSPLQIDPSGSYGQWQPSAQLIVTNNIFYMPNGSSTSGTAGMYRLWSGRPFTANNNLYADYGRTAVSGDRSIQYATGCTGPSDAGCSGLSYSQPGTGGGFYQATGQDGNSIYGSPGFLDSTLARFSPALLSTSLARGRGTGGSDIGAFQFAGTGGDVTPPSAVAALATVLASDQNLILSWAATGDDGMVGVASGYEMRRSTTAMNDASFGSGTAVSGLPVPGAPGTPQNVTVGGLSSGTTYYFGIRVRDEAGNWSPIRYYTTATSGSDQVPAAKVNDLSTGP